MDSRASIAVIFQTIVIFQSTDNYLLNDFQGQVNNELITHSLNSSLFNNITLGLSWYYISHVFVHCKNWMQKLSGSRFVIALM